MDLLEFHHADGRPVSFERTSVLLIEQHASGAGTLISIGPIERPHEMHLSEDYPEVKRQVTMSLIDRFVHGFDQNGEKYPPSPF